MENLLFWVPVFLAGIVVGVLSAPLLQRVWPVKNPRAELVTARTRILAGIKEKHEQEILREVFQVAETLDGEIKQSLHSVVEKLEKLLIQVGEERNSHSNTRIA